MDRVKCAVPSCRGRTEPVNWLGVCWRCRQPSNYGDDGIRSVYDPELPQPAEPEPEPFVWGQP